MNTNPQALTVLCYGDSNTFGVKPDRKNRFTANERWTGLLQLSLGDDYYIIEEGLSGRTTDLDHYNPDKPTLNGFTYFKTCLESHMPLDIIIIMLGTNDLKTIYERSSVDVAEALRKYPEYVTLYCKSRELKMPKIILVSPAEMNDTAKEFYESMPKEKVYDEISAVKSRMLREPIKKVAEEMGCLYFDAATVTETGEDGCHLTLESHKRLADSFLNLIKAN